MKHFIITYILFRRSHSVKVQADNQRLALKAFKQIMPEVTYNLLLIEKIDHVA